MPASKWFELYFSDEGKFYSAEKMREEGH